MSEGTPRAGKSNGNGPQTEGLPPLELAGARLGVKANEDNVALAWADLMAGEWLYDHTDALWYRWNGRAWLSDGRRLGLHSVRDFCRGVATNAALKQPKEVIKLRFWRNVEIAAAADPRLAFDASGWNPDGWQLGTPNGTVDLRTGKLLRPEPHHYINRFTSVAPAPAGTPHPLWTAFLGQATGQDRELETFLQRLAGYCLTTQMNEEILAFFYGPGGNGKGTFVSTLISIMGTYAKVMPIEAFTAGSFINMEYYRAQMHGPRLITASETEQQAFWSEQMLKDLTGNDTPLSGRNPRGRPFDFFPVAKIIVVGNYAPRLRSRTPAMERRLRVLPFGHIPTRPDPELKEKLRAEHPAILRWAIDGCLDWQRYRLGVPEAIKAASGTYFVRQDAWNAWLEECCDLDPALRTGSQQLLASYNAWAKRYNEDALTRNAFAEMLDRAGLRREHVRTGSLVHGIALRDTL